VKSRSGRGRWERVLEARRQARESLGRDPSQGSLFEAPPKAQTPLRLPEPPPYAPDPYRVEVHALSLGEAAARLGLGRGQLEAMVEAGRIDSLDTGYSKFIPASEVDRLTKH
jgi:excisionase family DNA binding protein